MNPRFICSILISEIDTIYVHIRSSMLRNDLIAFIIIFYAGTAMRSVRVLHMLMIF